MEPLPADIGDQIDPYQFAMKGRSTTQALVFLVHNVLETLDRGGSSARAFFADFSKGFDLALNDLAFMTRRKQCVRIRDKIPSFGYLNGGIPQGPNWAQSYLRSW